MCDDLNVAGAIGALSDGCSCYAVDAKPIAGAGPKTLQDEFNALQEIDSILGVLELSDEVCTGDLDINTIDSLIQARLDARTSKDWTRADEIRDELLKMGIEIKDSSDGTTWNRVVQ
jgi:cysteinyl-tRNA synthetase